MDGQKKNLCPRLIDYLAIIGTRTQANTLPSVQIPELLRRYPVEDHKDFPLPLDMVYFCQPEGCTTVGPKHSVLRETTSFTFALTDKDSGKTRYGTCVNFYRPVERISIPSTGSSVTVKKDKHCMKLAKDGWRKSMERSTDSAFSSDQRSCTVGPSDSERDLQNKELETTSTRTHLGVNVPSGDSESGESHLLSPKSIRRYHKSRNYSLTSLCIVSHHPFFSRFRECLSILKKLIDACNDNLSSQKIGGSRLTHRESVWTLLTSHGAQGTSSLVLHDVREIETWILRLLSAPVPIPNKTRVEVDILSPCIQPLCFALPDHTRFSLVDFPLHLPLELLGVDVCLRVLTLILLENKVVLQSRDYNALSMSVMAFVTMIYPLEYMFPTIPLLPTCMACAEQVLLAPTPFVIGIPASFLVYKKSFKMPEDIWFVDLDSGKIHSSTGRDAVIPAFPEPEGTILKNQLKQTMQQMDQAGFNMITNAAETHQMKSKSSMSPLSGLQPNSRRESTASHYSNLSVASSTRARSSVDYGNSTQCSPQSSPGKSITSSPSRTFYNTPSVVKPANQSAYNPLIYDNNVDSVDIAIRVAMVKFFNSQNILANFTEHTRTLRLYPRPVVAFQINSFLRSRPRTNEFLDKFARTQAVEFLAEWSLTPNNVAFLRVQTGVYDPAQIGDKPRWFADSLEAINFPVWNPSSSLVNAIKAMEELETQPTDESGSDSEDAESTSSSYSSLSDFVSEMVSSDLSPSYNGAKMTQQILLTIDSKTIYNPPETLQYPEILEDCQARPDSPVSTSSSHSDLSSSSLNRDSELELNPKDNNDFQFNKMPIQEEILSNLDTPINISNVVNRKSSTDTSGGPFLTRQMTIGENTFHAKPNVNERQPNSSINSHQQNSGDGHSSNNVVTRQASQGSLFEQIASQAKDLVRETTRQSSQDGLLAHMDKLKHQAKERISEAKEDSLFAPLGHITQQTKKAVDEATKSVQEASKTAIEASRTAAGVSKNTLDDLTYAGRNTFEDLTKSAKEVATKKGLLKGLAESQPSPEQHSSPRPSIRKDSNSNLPELRNKRRDIGRDFLSNVSSDFNGIATQTSNMFSDLFGSKSTSNRGDLASNIQKIKDKSQPLSFSPFKRGKPGLTDKSTLIKHMTSKNYSENMQRMQNIDRTNINNDNQAFLNEVINQVFAGEGVGFFKLNRLKKLMEDESYRNIIVTKLNRGINKKISPDDHIDDVCISRSVYKGMLMCLQAVANGLANTFDNNSFGGMASVFQLMEIAHTHYWSKDLTDGAVETPFLLQASSFESHENLRSNGSSKQSSLVDITKKLSSQYLNDGNQVHLEISHAISSNDNNNHSSTDSFLDLFSKKGKLLSKLTSFDGEGNSSRPSITSIINPSDAQSQARNKQQSNLAFRTPHQTPLSTQNTPSDAEVDREPEPTHSEKRGSIWSSKSSLNARYHGNSPVLTASTPSPEAARTYLFEGFLGKERLHLWDKMQFWEDAFLDAVSQERDVIGMDQGPSEMMERYKNLNDSERRRLEHDEDRLLCTLLHNLTAILVMLNVDKTEVKRKIRRLLGKSHIGLIYSQELHQLLDQIDNLHGNDIDLKPSMSRQMHKQSFTVHVGDVDGELRFLEVRHDGLVLRSSNGVIVERWWYERLVNMTCSPKNKVLCLSKRNGDQLELHNYYTKKCKDLYYCIKEAIEKAAMRGRANLGVELGDEFPVQDLQTGEGGLLQVCIEGVGLLFANSKFFVKFERIRKCFTQNGGIFVLEEYNPKTRQIIQHKYKSPMAREICYAVICVFSYLATGLKQRKISKEEHDTPRSQ
ncbi:MAP kinase-activating death domain protein isoform X2 [Chelonus insularis]|uniref:MAP kinase-activating death domain protein isoform X2 n=1 Tax=Chelonus insularis TaxID=460826 RepID=UPI00158A6326|nr:MAP kinase-activating death domain protein isoform X2 [Chelonus insularis]